VLAVPASKPRTTGPPPVRSGWAHAMEMCAIWGAAMQAPPESADRQLTCRARPEPSLQNSLVYSVRHPDGIEVDPLQPSGLNLSVSSSVWLDRSCYSNSRLEQRARYKDNLPNTRSRSEYYNGSRARGLRGHLRRCRASTMRTDIACGAAPCTWPRDARNAAHRNIRTGS
jgi:hypothetical protein